MREYYFLCSLPRAGNTLLGSILNQSKNIRLTANSILPEIIYQLYLLKKNQIFTNFPDHKSYNNIIKNVFNNYYQEWNVDNIISRGTWGTPTNLQLLKSIIKKPKFIILYRPILECLASFIKIEKPIDVELRCNQLLDKEDIIGKSLWSIKNIITNKEDYIVINYNDLVNNTNDTLKKIFNYLQVEFEDIDTNNIKQFSANNIFYDDSVLPFNLHTIRTNKIEFNKYNIEDYLPPNIIKDYSNLDI
jgi:excinuclease UvrABC nuclease subunit